MEHYKPEKSQQAEETKKSLGEIEEKLLDFEILFDLDIIFASASDEELETNYSAEERELAESLVHAKCSLYNLADSLGSYLKWYNKKLIE